MPDHQELRDQARVKTRSLLSYSQAFREMEREEQMALYKDLVDAHYNDLAEQSGLVTAMAAGDLIDEDRQYNQRIGRTGKEASDIMRDLVQKVDFPGFVRDLLVGVFDANQDANERQMVAYMKLFERATKSLSAFMQEVDDTEALVRLAQSDSQFKLGFPTGAAPGRRARQPRQSPGAPLPPAPTPASESSTAGTANPNQPTLMDQSGKPVDLSNNAVKAKLLDIKLAMAKEQRTMLRETILMGVSRLVVDKGVIRANVKFMINADEQTNNYDTGYESKNQRTEIGGMGMFGGGLFGARHSRGKTQISLATSNATMGSDLSAEMEGFVEIQFKSDYFKLDNFTQIFDLGQGQVAQGPAQQQVTPPPATTPIQSP